MEKTPCVYILTSKRNGTLYTGVTSDIVRRVWEHKNGFIDGFAKKYDVKMLVYYEVHEDMYEAIRREKIIKKWRRKERLQLIERDNPDWRDLYHDIIG